MATLTCPYCSMQLTVPNGVMGEKVTCPRGHSFVVGQRELRSCEQAPEAASRWTKLSAIGTCITALCVLALAVSHFGAPLVAARAAARAEAEKQARLEKLKKLYEQTRECVRMQEITDEADRRGRQAFFKFGDHRDENLARYDYLKEHGSGLDVRWLWQERDKLGKEVGFSEDELSHYQCDVGFLPALLKMIRAIEEQSSHR